ncbi:MAG: hypothetical protein U9R41_08485, partial [Candidatus Marinimicrobia bacterium]|nr:hypothetical protein [Candidatus Neomarinimicrobiota bacterium]
GKNMKKILLIVILLTSFSYGQVKIETMANVQKFSAIDLHITDFGTSIGWYRQFAPIGKFHYGFWINATMVTGGQETTIRDPYTGYSYKINEISLDFVKAGISLKYHLFKGKIANSFSPFLSTQLGGVIALDTPENTSFFKKYEEVEYYYGVTYNFYIGIDFLGSPQYEISVAVGYETNYLNAEVDGDKNWNGKAVYFQYGKFF